MFEIELVPFGMHFCVVLISQAFYWKGWNFSYKKRHYLEQRKINLPTTNATATWPERSPTQYHLPKEVEIFSQE